MHLLCLLVTIADMYTLDLSPWRELLCVQKTRQLGERIAMRHVRRDILMGPHVLANHARTTRMVEQSTAPWQHSIAANWRQEWYQLDPGKFLIGTGTHAQQAT